jgi:hypothetical protein
MAKKKKLTLFEKQIEDRLHELYLRFVKVHQYNPDYLRELRYVDFHDYKCMIAMAERARDAGRISEEDFEFLKRELGGFTIAKIYLREYLGSEIESIISKGDSILSIKEQLKPHPGLLFDLFIYILNPFPNEKLPVSFSGKGSDFYIDLRFTDNKIVEAIDRYLEFFLSPEGQEALDLRGYRPQLEDGRVLKVIRDPGKGPYGPDLDSSMLVVSINFDAGKMKIRKELKKLLKKLSPRDTESTPRFHRDTLEGGYEIYDLKLQGLSFKQISAKVGRSYKTVKRLHKDAWGLIHPGKDYSTKSLRRQENQEGEEYPFDDKKNGWGTWIAYSNAPDLKHAERFYAKQCDTGTRTPRLEDEEPDENKPFQSVLVAQLDRSKAGTAFDKLISRVCLRQFLKAEGYEQCGCEPGSPRCNGCNHLSIVYRASELPKWTIEPGSWKGIKLQIDGIPWDAYVENFTNAPVSGAPTEGIPGRHYISYRYQRLEEKVVCEHEKGLTRGKELEWQRGYTEENNVEPWVRKFKWDGEKTIREIIVGENFGPIWWKAIKHFPRAPIVPCADCGGECPDGNTFPCDKLLEWLKGRHFPTSEIKKYKKQVHCPSCKRSNTEPLVTLYDSKPYQHSDVWVCQCGSWFTPVSERYADMLSQFTRSLVSANVEDYLIALLDEAEEHDIDVVFEIVTAAPIEKVHLGSKEDTTPLIIREWKPLLGSWPALYDDVYGKHKTWKERWRAIVNPKHHLIKPKKKYYPTVTTQDELTIYERKRKYENRDLIRQHYCVNSYLF